ncbi:hypothetical protein [Liquorilactobacillus sicerae]|uniref:hypothetical protein n=1 Tax=Liquorilactobacillus sicerae TaxID=1416943 RepID=UPI0024804C82|nr:hypothetical protein [Liquorilactobacillus sicerae]
MKVYFFKKGINHQWVWLAFSQGIYLAVLISIGIILLLKSRLSIWLLCASSLILGFISLNGIFQILNYSLAKTRATIVFQRLATISFYLLTGSLLFYPTFLLIPKVPGSGWTLFGIELAWIIAAIVLIAVFNLRGSLFWSLSASWLFLLACLFTTFPTWLILIDGLLLQIGIFFKWQQWLITGDLISSLTVACFLLIFMS